MGHLYYSEFGLSAQSFPGYSSDQLKELTVFGNLVGGGFAGIYWTMTPTTWNGMSYTFDMSRGGFPRGENTSSRTALIVNPAEVAAVPIPGALWLLGSGLAGLGLFRRRKTSRA